MEKRNLPPIPLKNNLPDREKMLSILAENVYGKFPDFPTKVSAQELYREEHSFGGKGTTVHYCISLTTPKGIFSFPLYLTYPVSGDSVPLMVYLSFPLTTPSGQAPEEEILDSGVALARIIYTDITADCDDHFSSGLAAMYWRDYSSNTEWGKIGMWAFAVSKALDFLLTLSIFDKNKIGVLGHSRLGKSILWCAANDTRFTHIFSNNAGCCGDALHRGKTGETLKDITRVFGYWFCDKLKIYADQRTAELPFDQHYLLSLIAPRNLSVGASLLDDWADPKSEFACCLAVGPAYEAYGKPAFSPSGKFPSVGSLMTNQSISFHLRQGMHFLSREDWHIYLNNLLA